MKSKSQQKGFILLTLLIYLLLFNIIILATYDLVHINTQFIRVAEQQQQLDKIANLQINSLINELHEKHIPLCLQLWKTSNTFYLQTPKEWNDFRYCQQTVENVKLQYVIELKSVNPCEVILLAESDHYQQAQRYRITQRAILNKMQKVTQITGVIDVAFTQKICQASLIYLDPEKHSWRSN